MGSPEKNVTKLGYLATEKLTQLLQQSVSNMNRIIVSDIKKQFMTSFSNEKSTSNDGKSKPTPEASSPIDEASLLSIPINQITCAKAALQMMAVRKYLMNGMINPAATKMTLTPQVIQQIISTAIDTKSMGLIRLVICQWVDVLDFRALDKYSSRVESRKPPSQTTASVSPSSKMISSSTFLTSHPLTTTTSPLPSLSSYCLPADEFDWFSRDRLGSIISMPEACELFSILGMSQCAPNIKELYLNARRKEYWTCPPDIMEITADILVQLTNLTTLVLRGMCDDYMLKLIGQSASGLKHLDVSGSHFVTDAGLKNLFFRDICENPATYLMKSFIDKNLRNMNPLVRSLEMLDYSWTNVTALTRKMVSYLPGAFVFKRVFTRNENYAYGHHIFLKTKCLAKALIPSLKPEDFVQFDRVLEPLIGMKGVKTFLKLVEQHPWKNCTLYIYEEKQATEWSPKFYGIVIPSDEERRIYGTINFQDSILTDMYSMFPINLNILGDSCPKLQVFRGTVTDVWKMNSSVLSELTILDMFADPGTTKSLLESCPNLRKVRIRILRERLTDEYIIKPLTTFMCCRTLEELWIAPGTYKANLEQSANANVDDSVTEIQWQSFNEVRANYYSAERPPRTKSSMLNNNELLQEDKGSGSECEECQIDDHVHLTSDCIRTILGACQKLERIGDLAWWTPVSETNLEEICKELRESKREVTFVWENKIFS